MIYDKKHCPDIMSDYIWDFVGHEQILVGQCPMTDSYLQPCFKEGSLYIYMSIAYCYLNDPDQCT